MKRLILLMLSTMLYAHPHLFVDLYPKILPDTVEIRWVFDEMNSQMLIMDYDTDGDGVFTPAEQESVRQDLFDFLGNYGYYTYFYSAAGPLPTPQPKRFGAAIEAGRIVFVFTLLRPKNATQIRFHDTDNLTGYTLKEEFVKAANNGKSYPIRGEDYDFYFGYILELQ